MNSSLCSEYFPSFVGYIRDAIVFAQQWMGNCVGEEDA